MRNLRRSVLPPVLALALVLAWFSRASAFWPPDGLAVTRLPHEQVTPSVIPDGSGGVMVAWSDSRAGHYDIFAQRVSARGSLRWAAEGVRATGAPLDQSAPRMIPDGLGGAILVWQDERNGDLDIYAQRIDPSGRTQWGDDGMAVCVVSGAQYRPDLVPDGKGGAIVSWQDERGGIAQRDVFVQRIDAAGSLRWSQGGVALHSTRGKRPAIASDGRDGALVAWEDSLSDTDSDIRMQRVDSLGTASWSPGGAAVAVLSGVQTLPVVTPDGALGALVAWQDGRNASPAVYAQRLDAAGGVQWPANGLLLSLPGEAARAPVLAAEGASGGIFVWQDHRNGGTPDLYGQRVEANGSVSWTAGGAPVAISTAQDQIDPSIDVDGEGGAIVSWFDFTPRVGSDIRAQRVDAAGKAMWGANGVSICGAEGNQSFPRVVSNGVGGAFVAWQDRRNGADSDIYLARVLPDGATVEVPASVYFLPNYPNPFHPSTQFEFGLPEAARATLRIYDSAGRLVRTLIDGTRYAGVQGVTWDGRDDRGTPAPSGVYFARFIAPGIDQSRKLTLVR